VRFMTILLSGTGNTAWAATKLGEAALGSGHEHALMSAQEALASGPSELAAVADGRGLAACLCTMGYVDAQGPFAAFRAMRAAGLEPRGYLPVLMSNNVCVPRIPMNPAPARLIERRKAVARSLIGRFAAALGSGERFVRGIGPYLIPGIVIRKLSSKRLERPSMLWSWEGSRCSRCGLCVRECPMGALRLGEGGLSIGEECTYCTRCYNRCPTQAILPEGEFAPPDRYPRYLCPAD
jgi:NAD-dependent dihydropyrimidine dehydrogenase PreA subunit